MSEARKHPTFASGVFYEDPMEALSWLETAFGFERSMVITDDRGRLAHAEMSFGNGYIMVGSPWADFVGTPKLTGGKNTQMVHVQVEEGIDALCERARQAGGVIQQECSDQFYGDRTFRCVDPGGHVWTFGQTIREVKPEEWGDAGAGLKATFGPGSKR